MKRAPRIGVMTLQNAPWATLLERWRYLEELGFESVWVADHFVMSTRPSDPWLEGWAAWSSAARTGRYWNTSPQKRFRR